MSDSEEFDKTLDCFIDELGSVVRQEFIEKSISVYQVMESCKNMGRSFLYSRKALDESGEALNSQENTSISELSFGCHVKIIQMPAAEQGSSPWFQASQVWREVIRREVGSEG